MKRALLTFVLCSLTIQSYAEILVCNGEEVVEYKGEAWGTPDIYHIKIDASGGDTKATVRGKTMPISVSPTEYRYLERGSDSSDDIRSLFSLKKGSLEIEYHYYNTKNAHIVFRGTCRQAKESQK